MGLIDGAVAQAGYGKTYGLTTGDPAGSTLSGQSSSKILTAGVSNTANSWRLLRSAEDPENDENAAGRSVLVAQNLNQFLTNSLSWQ